MREPGAGSRTGAKQALPQDSAPAMVQVPGPVLARPREPGARRPTPAPEGRRALLPDRSPALSPFVPDPAGQSLAQKAAGKWTPTSDSWSGLQTPAQRCGCSLALQAPLTWDPLGQG